MWRGSACILVRNGTECVSARRRRKFGEDGIFVEWSASFKGCIHRTSCFNATNWPRPDRLGRPVRTNGHVSIRIPEIGVEPRPFEQKTEIIRAASVYYVLENEKPRRRSCALIVIIAKRIESTVQADRKLARSISITIKTWRVIADN